MGEVFHAFQHLNDTLRLGLSGEQLARGEASFKAKFAQVAGHNLNLTGVQGNQDAIAENYEFVATLQPRARKLSTAEIRTLADRAVMTNLAGITLGAKQT